jgi:hypothetical protein
MKKTKIKKIIEESKIDNSNFVVYNNDGEKITHPLISDINANNCLKNILLLNNEISFFDTKIILTNKKIVIKTEDASFCIDLNKYKSFKIINEFNSFTLIVNEEVYSHKIVIKNKSYKTNNLYLILEEESFIKIFKHILDSIILMKIKDFELSI